MLGHGGYRLYGPHWQFQSGDGGRLSVSPFHASTLATTLAPAVAPASSSVSLSYSYIPLFQISRLLNHLPLLSSFLALNYLHVFNIYRPLFSSTSSKPFCLSRWLRLSFLLLLPHLMNSSSPATLIPLLSRGVVCVLLRLAVLIQNWRVTDRQTHTDTRKIRWRLIPAPA